MYWEAILFLTNIKGHKMGFKQNFIAKKLEQELKIKNGIVSVDKNSCDGCGSCIAICPQSAIQMIILSNEDVKQMPFKGRLKVKIKGNNKAYIDEDLCTNCGLCMKQCHEFAIHKTIRK